MKAKELDGFRTTLLDEKARLTSALEYLRAGSPSADYEQIPELSSLEGHLAEAGAITLDREIDFTLEEATRAHLEAIERALVKIEQGHYGECDSCGQVIADERLAALPWTTLCIDCKRREERG